MAKLVLAEFLSLDGVMEAPEEWHFPFIDDALGAHMLEDIRATEAMLLGRKTYDIFAAAWPGRDDEAGMARHINGMPKYVVSSTLDSADWENSHLIRGNLADEVRKLKQLPVTNVVITGSAQLANALIRENLIDEYRLLVHPVVVGKGKKLFAEGTQVPALTLVDSKVFGTGVIATTYVPAGGASA